MYENIKLLQRRLKKSYILLAISILGLFVGICFFSLTNLWHFETFLQSISSLNLNFKKQDISLTGNILGSDNLMQLEQLGFNGAIDDKISDYKANIYTFKKDFDKALEDMGQGTWQQYFNLGNIGLFAVNEKLNQSGSLIYGENAIGVYQGISQSIDNYDTALSMVSTGSRESGYIHNNQDISIKLKYLAGTKICVDSYMDSINNLSQIKEKLKRLLDIFDQQEKLLQDFVNKLGNGDLKNCLTKYAKSFAQSKFSLMTLDNLIGEYTNQAKSRLTNNLLEPEQCMTDLSQNYAKISSGVNTIYKSIDEFQQIHEVLLQALQSNDTANLDKMCQNSDNYSDKNSDISDKLNDGMSKLDQGLNNKNSGDKKGNQDKPTQNNPQPMHQDITGSEKKVIEEIKNNSRQWLDEMNKIKSDPNYDVKDYLNQLFQDFFGNDETFGTQAGGGAKYDSDY